MSDSANENAGSQDGGGLSVTSVLIRGVIFLVALALLVVGGLFALSVIKGNIQYYQAFDGCESDDLEACYDLARHYCNGEHVAEDDWKCQSLLEQNCAAGHARSCTHAGWNYYEGDADDEVENLVAAIEACEGGDLRGCHVAGSPHVDDDDRPDEAEPREVYAEKACRRGLAAACHEWLWWLEEDEAPDSAVREAAEAGCEQGYREPCIELGALLIEDSDRRNEGRALLEQHCPSPDDRCFPLVEDLAPRDESAAQELAAELCMRGVEPACGWLGERAEPSDSGRAEALKAYACQSYRDVECEVEAERAKRHGERCSVEAPVSCAVYARFLARDMDAEWDYDRYRHALQTACDGGMISSCSILVYKLRHTDAERELLTELRERTCAHGFLHTCGESRAEIFASYPASPDPEAIIETLEARCVEGLAGACEDLVGWYAHALEIWTPRPQFELAERYASVACEEGDARGCSAAAIIHIGGLSPVFLPPDVVEKQASRHERACSAGFAYACLQHGLMFLDGGRPRDPERGKQILEDYCRSDQPWICWRLIDFYRNGDYLEKDLERAKTIEKALCNAGADEACGG